MTARLRALAVLAPAAAFVLAFVLARFNTPAAMPDAVRIPIVRPHPPGLPGAVFFHGDHANFMCHNCHPAVFPGERAGFTHDDFEDGRFCAVCHDGDAAWPIQGAACDRCHVTP